MRNIDGKEERQLDATITGY